MQNCTIFSPSANAEILAGCIRDAFEPFRVNVSGPADNWQQIVITAKTSWFKKETLTVHLRSFRQPDEFVPMMQGMMNLASGLPAQNSRVQMQLLTKIQQTQTALGLVAAAGFGVFEEGILRLAAFANAFLFVDGREWRHHNGELILNTAGQCGLEDLGIPDRDIQLGQNDAQHAGSLFESQLQRKSRSIEWLRLKNIPVIEHLPCIAADEEVELRSTNAVVERIIAIAITAAKGEGLEDAIVQKVIEQFNAMPFFTPAEAAFTAGGLPSQQNRIKFTWRYEGLWVLLWTLGYVDELKYPDSICDVSEAVTIIKEAGSFGALLNSARPRPVASILDAADLTCRMNWACVNARIRNEAAPAGLDAGVVYERHYAFNWLTSYHNQDWDDVSTDT